MQEVILLTQRPLLIKNSIRPVLDAFLQWSPLMSRLQIAGSVLYSDLKPASSASVEIWELDDLPGGSNDKILNRTTDAYGQFSGLSSEWNDAEGKAWGVPIPDVMRLEFIVKVDGKSHKGPFLLLNGKGTPIILPFGPPKPISKSERELVQIIYLSSGYTGNELALYDFIENSSAALAATLLGPVYNCIRVIRGNDATLTNFKKELTAATSASSAGAVDVMFNVHGATDSIPLKDGNHTIANVQTCLSSIPPVLRKKFRAVFSTACFGASHLNMWRQVGFDVACGARGIYADSASSFAPMLGKWATEGTFGEAIQLANSLGGPSDAATIAYYNINGKPSSANQVNSRRSVIGPDTTRIYSKPLS